MKLTLRTVRESDKELLFVWANDPETRRNSFNALPIPWADHERWFADRIQDRDTRIFIAQDERGHAVGLVRFHKRGDHAYLSLSVEQQSRRKGIATKMTILGCEAIFEEWQEIGYVLGEVKRTNEPQRRMCVKTGFLEEDTGGDVIVYKKFRNEDRQAE